MKHHLACGCSDPWHERESARSAVELYGTRRGASVGYGGHGELVVTELRCMLSSVLVVVIAGCLLFGQGADGGRCFVSAY